MLHKNILSEEQISLLPLIKKYKRKFYLVGGTAIALQIGHRRSIDFDLFTPKNINRDILEQQIRKNGLKFKTLHQKKEEWTLIINNIKITFFNYPFDIDAKIDFDNIIKLPSLINLAAMKAYALGNRSKWKDYVDLYFILNYHSINEISKRANEIYGETFNEKLFRVQLAYHDDIDYSEKVEFLINAPSDDEIKNFLIKTSLKN